MVTKNLVEAIRAEGLEAELPEGYQWGPDALESFEMGKRCATTAILAYLQSGPVPIAPLDPDLQESLGHHGPKARDRRRPLDERAYLGPGPGAPRR